MDLNFYGQKNAPPTRATAQAFGVDAEPVLLQGGQGTSYRAGSIVLKPAESEEVANWSGEVFLKLPESAEVRFARPIKSTQEKWIHDGYVAWSFLEGEHVKGNYAEKLVASRAFHNLLKDFPKPHFLKPRDSWSTADHVAWHEDEFDYDEEFMALFHQIKPHLQKPDAQNQLVHGDMSGNFIFHPGLPPAIIDFSPAWAPSGFAEGILLADAIAWEHADPKSVKVFKTVPNIEQFAWRGILRRITEQAEHIKWLGKPKEQAVREAREFLKAIDLSQSMFPWEFV